MTAIVTITGGFFLIFFIYILINLYVGWVTCPASKPTGTQIGLANTVGFLVS